MIRSTRPCTVCERVTSWGDLFYCEPHREGWRDYLKKKGLSEFPNLEDEVIAFHMKKYKSEVALKSFINKIVPRFIRRGR